MKVKNSLLAIVFLLTPQWGRRQSTCTPLLLTMVRDRRGPRIAKD